MPAPDVSVHEAHELVHKNKQYVYLDVRTEGEFNAGHPEGAYNIPVAQPGASGRMEPNPKFLKVMEANFSKDTAIIVGCQAGGRSRMACQQLTVAGYSNLKNCAGGFGGGPDGSPGWASADLPVSKQTAPGHDYASLSKKAGV